MHVIFGGVLASTGVVDVIKTRVEELPGLVKRQKTINAEIIAFPVAQQHAAAAA